MSASAARVAAQAKVNLRLRVLAREMSGFHALETIFARLELADAVTVRVGGAGRSVDTMGADVGPAERNLAYRAAAAYASATGWPEHFAIEIEKRIPVGAGLGGGSADAGATLRALRALHAQHAQHALRVAQATVPTDDALVALAAGLGADVPFFTTDAPVALAWSRGDRLLRLPALPPRNVLLLVPAFGVVTGDAYAWLAATRRAADAPAACVIADEQLRSWRGIAALATNDFEPVVAARHSEIGALLAALRARGACVALLAGSGSVVFGVFDGAAPDASAFVSGDLASRVIRTRIATRVVPVEMIG